MKTPGFNVVLGAIVLSLGSVLPAQGQTPAITSQVLPTLDMQIAIATSIADNGMVGGVAGAGGKLHAVRWQNGEITDLGNVCDTCLGAIVYDINNSGHVVGVVIDGANVFKPIAHTGTALSELPMPAGFTSGYANDINNNGQIAGYGQHSSGAVNALLWASATSVPAILPLYAGLGLTEAGDVAGAAPSSCNALQAAIFRNGAVEAMATDDPCAYSLAYALNAKGLVAGLANPVPGTTRVAVWDNAVRQLLEPFGGFKQTTPAQHPLNEFGDVAGMSSDPVVASPCYSVATAWLPEGQLAMPSPSPGPGCDYSNAWAINKHAQIAGSFSDASSNTLPVIWTIDVDRQDPEVTTSTATPTIAPPNKKMVPVTFTGTILDEHLASASYAVTDEYGLLQPAGSITVAPSGAYSFTVMLEARRDGGDRDRTYTMVVSATDAGGRTGSAAAVVTVKAGKK